MEFLTEDEIAAMKPDGTKRVEAERAAAGGERSNLAHGHGAPVKDAGATRCAGRPSG